MAFSTSAMEQAWVEERTQARSSHAWRRKFGQFGLNPTSHFEICVGGTMVEHRAVGDLIIVLPKEK